MSMTLAAAWVRRGVAAQFPQKYEVDEVELERIEKLAKLQLRDAQDDLSAAQDRDEDYEDVSEDDSDQEKDSEKIDSISQPSGAQNDDDLKEYNLSDYDDDDDNDGDHSIENGKLIEEKFAMFGNVKSLAYHIAGEEDPYLVLPDGEHDSDDEREDLEILPTDNLILAAKVEDEVPHLEVLVYEDDEENIYVHHDIMLPAIPLCLEWLDNPVSSTTAKKTLGNFVAVGMMSPEVEVWDLDIVNGMYPAAILGAAPEELEVKADSNGDAAKSKKSKKDKKKPKKPKANDHHHVDAVLALSLNPHHRNLLASGSADKTIKLWDLNAVDHSKCAKSFQLHDGKITSLNWHPSAERGTVLLSGSADDHTIRLSDMRSADSGTVKRWTVESDIEKVRWDPHSPDFFYVTTEQGLVYYFNSGLGPTNSNDNLSKPIWTLQAHDGTVSAFDIHPFVPGCLVTGSDDKKVKIWNVQDNKPSLVISRNLEVGRVFSALFAPDEEVCWRVCVAGSKGEVQVWDTSTNRAVREVFASRVKSLSNVNSDRKERIIRSNTANDDDEDDDSDDEAGVEIMDQD